jgi:hypothetical protein
MKAILTILAIVVGVQISVAALVLKDSLTAKATESARNAELLKPIDSHKNPKAQSKNAGNAKPIQQAELQKLQRFTVKPTANNAKQKNIENTKRKNSEPKTTVDESKKHNTINSVGAEQKIGETLSKDSAEQIKSVDIDRKLVASSKQSEKTADKLTGKLVEKTTEILSEKPTQKPTEPLRKSIEARKTETSGKSEADIEIPEETSEDLIVEPVVTTDDESIEFDNIKASTKELLKDTTKSNAPDPSIKVINAEVKFEDKVRAANALVSEAVAPAAELDKAIGFLRKKDESALCATLGRLPAVISRARDAAWDSGKRIFHQNLSDASQTVFGITSYCGATVGDISKGDSEKLEKTLNDLGNQIVNATKKQL